MSSMNSIHYFRKIFRLIHIIERFVQNALKQLRNGVDRDL